MTLLRSKTSFGGLALAALLASTAAAQSTTPAAGGGSNFTSGITIPSGQGVVWNADTTLSRASAGVITAGNGGSNGFAGALLTGVRSIQASGVVFDTFDGPTLSSGFGSGAAVSGGNNGAAAFKWNVGTGGSASSGVITLGGTATHGWVCDAHDITTPATNVTEESATTTTTVTFVNYSRTTGSATAWPASDLLVIKCAAF